MRESDLALWFFRQLASLRQDDTLSLPVRSMRLYELMRRLLKERTRGKELHFNTLFALIAYACQTYGIPEDVQGALQRFRYLVFKLYDRPSDDLAREVLDTGWPALVLAVAGFYQSEIPEALKEQLPEGPLPQARRIEAVEYMAYRRVLLISHLPEEQCFYARLEDDPDQKVVVCYGSGERHDLYSSFFKKVLALWPLPFLVGLEELSIDEQGVYHPRSFILEPDYLLDVTTIAEAMDGPSALVSFLLKKYMPFSPGKPVLLGHIANFFLDELMNEPEAEFKQLFAKVFKLNPLGFARLSDADVREIMQAARQHFLTIKSMVRQGFAQEDIERGKSYLEPTFYSERHGLQGRLDILYRGADKTSIVELKSGRIFNPNQYGINSSHFVQTLLYDLIIRHVFRQTTPRNYMLYSGSSDTPLRYAPPVKEVQREALQRRNELLLVERAFLETFANRPDGNLDQSPAARLFEELRPERQTGLFGFRRDNLRSFSRVYESMRPVERHYFLAFSGFIAREHQLAKLGHDNSDRRHGQASLWRLPFLQKDEDYQVLAHLKLVENKASEEEPLLVFQRTEKSNPLANFRQGDLVVLYPDLQAPLAHQLFKCTLVEIDTRKVKLRLRARQFNSDFFEMFDNWQIEHDLLDSSFLSLYRSLYAFADAPLQKRRLLLAEEAPPLPVDPPVFDEPENMTAEQKKIFKKIISSRAYFLLWGPPGTGKTSIMLREMVRHFFQNTEENLLLLAYTNRAVDEICAAIEGIHPSMRNSYLRIGSSYATDVAYRDRLLSRQVEQLHSRRELVDLIQKHRIFVGTVASFAGRQELLHFKKFHRVIVDEASQILEPMLMGLLPQFEHFTLIGDHRQLPAVVVQTEEDSAVGQQDLVELGLTNMRNSLFERLYRQAQKNAWEHAFAQLSHQGRMHADIMRYPNLLFYKGRLKLLPEPLNERQIKPLQWRIDEAAPAWKKRLASQRVLFFNCQVDEAAPNDKTNQYEAEKIAEILIALRQMYRNHGSELNNEQVGIITPYRAQIACIRQALEAHGLETENLTIDTVERLQGGARDVIFISFCANSLRQMETLSTLTEEGIDRKLNVALTRAREQLILLGNRAVLESSNLYKQLLDEIYSWQSGLGG